MPEAPFVHLHCHTDYSLLDGACEIGRLMDLVVEQKMPAVAITDHGNLFGAMDFYRKAVQQGVHPVIGCEVYVSRLGRHTRSDTDRYTHLVLLCENQDGYKNLIKLTSSAYLEGFYRKPRIDMDLLAEHSKGLIGLSACLKGDVNQALLEDNYDEARRFAHSYQDILGKDHFFLEVQDHGLEQDKIVIPGNVRLSRETGIPLVVTNDSHYLRKEDARAHEVLLCVSTGKTMSDSSRMRWSNPDFYIKSRAEMMSLFGELEDAVDRTWEIADRCRVKLEKVKEPFPKFDVPSEHSTDSYFEHVVREGFELRKPRLDAMRAAGTLQHDLPDYEERLNSEIQIIKEMKFPGYFLIVWDFMRFARSCGIPVGPGRGSAAGSLASYAMRITDIDPLQYGLIFERFLNPERISLPDIDIDFCTHRRGEVIQYVTEKYGREQVAQIITFGTLGAKAAIKDVGRALDMSFAEVERITKLVPAVLNIKLDEAIKKEPGFREAAERDSRVAELLEIARRLEGLSRNASVHAAGVVISPVPLRELVPLCRTNRDEVVTQYDMKGLEKLDLLKMDFLGLTTLTIVNDTLKLIEKNRGVKLILEDLPLDDAKTFDIFSKGYTSGVFQFESRGMRDILRRSQPSRIEDLIALNALYRPGPIQGGMVDDFIDRKHGRKPIKYDLPELKQILEETYGVIVYQEQVMQISNRIAGYSLGEADLLRRAMGKKKAEVMAAQRERFIKGATEKGFPQRKVAKIFDLMAQFAGYGFNKSHSAAYAYLAYLTAYLKARYPLDFMAALLTSETGNTAKIVKYINECREMGIKVLPPDVNSSELDFTPVPEGQGCTEEGGSGIRFGLGAIKNLGQSAVEAIVAARREGGCFRTLDQLCEKVDLSALNKRMIESLIKAGAMDTLEGTRAQLFLSVEAAMEDGQRAWRDRESGQTGLFMDSPEERAPARPLPDVPEWTSQETLAGEKEMLGFYVTGHPLEQYEQKVSALATHSSETLEGLERGTAVALCGVLTTIQNRRNRDGKPWASVQLEDREGTIDLLVFASTHEQVAKELVVDKPVLVRGLVLPEENGPPKISVQDVVPLDVARVPVPSLIAIRVWLGKTGDGTLDRAEALQQLFGRCPGQTEVRLRLEKARDFSVIFDVRAKIHPDKDFYKAVEEICGPEAIEILAV